jgi:hypothetical protein
MGIGKKIWMCDIQAQSFRPASYRPTFFYVPFRTNFGDIQAQVFLKNKMMVTC